VRNVLVVVGRKIEAVFFQIAVDGDGREVRLGREMLGGFPTCRHEAGLSLWLDSGRCTAERAGLVHLIVQYGTIFFKRTLA
jgi:hypothetical protein